VVVVVILKALVMAEILSKDALNLITDGSVYGAFSLVLSFTLVFRCQQGYQRYTDAAKAMHTMSSEWIDACGSLLSFIQVSKKPHSDKQQFEGVLVRLFCLMHAVAMEELCNKGENFKLLDIEAFVSEDLSILQDILHNQTEAQRRKLQIQYIFAWIKLMIIQGMDSGLLSVPPPILTRVYQEIGAGMAEFHEAQLISMWPFPFPYAQLSLFLSVLHLFLTPLIMASYSTDIWSSALLTYVSIVCVMSLNIIGVELENPFGEDKNDLPAVETHEEFRSSILALTNPDLWHVPRTKALMESKSLKDKSGRRISLSQHLLGKALEDDFPATPVPASPQNKDGSPGYVAPVGIAPAQLEILERHLNKQSAMLETYLARQQALIEMQSRPSETREVKASAPPAPANVSGPFSGPFSGPLGPPAFSPDSCCSISSVRPRPLI